MDSVCSPKKKGGATDLLESGDWQLQSAGKDPKLEPIPVEQIVTVRLLQTCQISTRHCRLTPVGAIGKANGEIMLFCPNEELKESGATPALCVTNVGDNVGGSTEYQKPFDAPCNYRTRGSLRDSRTIT